MTKAELLNLLKVAVSNTDLAYHKDDKLGYAIDYATNEVKNRLGLEETPAKYDFNIVEGAKWYLAREGTEGEMSHSENGNSRMYKEVPDWLKSIPSRVGVARVRKK